MIFLLFVFQQFIQCLRFIFWVVSGFSLWFELFCRRLQCSLSVVVESELGRQELQVGKGSVLYLLRNKYSVEMSSFGFDCGVGCWGAKENQMIGSEEGFFVGRVIYMDLEIIKKQGRRSVESCKVSCRIVRNERRLWLEGVAIVQFYVICEGL